MRFKGCYFKTNRDSLFTTAAILEENFPCET